ncbi:MAG TPA: glycosyltransferase [Anaeromyxobacteraceae bacterium]|nr:glycosyltransferase [Anaeromyxobacteraceae bacterium]
MIPSASALAEASPRVRVSVGIMAHNEEANIGQLVEALLAQRGARLVLSEVIVVASGCTDGTEDVVRRWSERDARVELVVQPRREGKASAVNLFLARAREEVLVLCSADLVPAPGTLERVVDPFREPEIGLTTCRPVPVDDPRTFLGFAAHLLWDLHHRMNLVAFKAGELVAFRKVFQRIPYKTSVDEASIEPVIRGQGYGVRYVASAIVRNKGPETIADFLSQRRRIYAGHLALRHEVGYRVSTLSGWKVLGLVLRGLPWRPRAFAWTWAVAALELYGRLLGRRDYRSRRDHSVWAIATTTKRLAPPAPATAADPPATGAGAVEEAR